jgi:hypothetical protein
MGTQIITSLVMLARWSYYAFDYSIDVTDAALLAAYVPALALAAAAAPVVSTAYYLSSGMFLSTLARTQARALLASLGLLCIVTAGGAVSYLLGEVVFMMVTANWLRFVLDARNILVLVICRPVIYNLVPHVLMAGLALTFFLLSIRRLAGEHRPIF